MRTYIVSAVVAAASLCALTAASMAQTAAPPQHVPLQKTIGQAARPEVVPSLFVLNSRGATLQGGKLDVDRRIAKLDRVRRPPVASAGHELTAHILEEWSPANTDSRQLRQGSAERNRFRVQQAGTGVRDAVVVLKNPKLDGDS